MGVIKRKATDANNANVRSSIVAKKANEPEPYLTKGGKGVGLWPSPSIMKPVYRVYEAQNPGESEVYRVAMSGLRELSFREEIARGERLVQLIRLVAETDDRNEARAQADCEV